MPVGRTVGPWTARAGLGLLLAFAVVAVGAGLLAPYGPDERVARPFTPPGSAHLLGTNDVGEDIFSELVHGTRTALLVGLPAALLATVLGGAVGVLSGCARRAVDALLMRAVDLTLVLPFVPLLIVAAAYAGRGAHVQIVVIGAVLWAAPARILRSQVLSVRARGHVQAARAVGAGRPHILLRHVLPAVAPLLVLEFVRAVQIAVLLEAALAFLGLGDPSRESWGNMLFYATARGAFLSGAWRWWVAPPGAAIAAFVLAFALVGLYLEERADPRLRTRAPRMTV